MCRFVHVKLPSVVVIYAVSTRWVSRICHLLRLVLLHGRALSAVDKVGSRALDYLERGGLPADPGAGVG